jgi:hypothetical protein
MLIAVRQLSQDTEERREFGEGTVDGLETPNGIAYHIRNTAQPLLGVLLEPVQIIPNDEGGEMTAFGFGSGGKLSDSIDEMIQGVSQVRDTIPNHEAPTLEVGLLSTDMESHPKFGELFVLVGCETVRVCVQPCSDFRAYGIEVTVRPS